MFDFSITAFTGPILGSAFLIFVLRVTDVSMSTLRMIMITRGMRIWAALVGFIAITIWVVAISQVITHLDNIWNILGYSGGFAVGTLVGMWLEDKLALGYVDIHVVSMTKGTEIAQKVRTAGFGATELLAKGRSGPVSLVDVVARRKQVRDVLHLVNGVDSNSFVTVEEARQVLHGYQRLAK